MPVSGGALVDLLAVRIHYPLAPFPTALFCLPVPTSPCLRFCLLLALVAPCL